jgi:3-methyladenine DNA glycosylase AlkD
MATGRTTASKKTGKSPGGAKKPAPKPTPKPAPVARAGRPAPAEPSQDRAVAKDATSVAKPKPAPKTSKKAPRAPKPRSLTDVMKDLEAAGSPEARSAAEKRGVTPPHFGSSPAALTALAAAIGTDHDLAEGLWHSGNFDAMDLATRIAVPARMAQPDLDRWARRVASLPASALLAPLAAQSRDALRCVRAWTALRSEFTRTCGFDLLAALLEAGTPIPDETLGDTIATIAREIHTSPNRSKHAMNACLAAIGIHRAGLREAALAAADKIGPLKIDHGATDVTTEPAAALIRASGQAADGG